MAVLYFTQKDENEKKEEKRVDFSIRLKYISRGDHWDYYSLQNAKYFAHVINHIAILADSQKDNDD